MFSVVCVVWSGRGLCNKLITRPEESYRLWCVIVCDYETPWYEEAIARAGLQSHNIYIYIDIYIYCIYLTSMELLITNFRFRNISVTKNFKLHSCVF
jgi:hypothetical protein